MQKCINICKQCWASWDSFTFDILFGGVHTFFPYPNRSFLGGNRDPHNFRQARDRHMIDLSFEWYIHSLGNSVDKNFLALGSSPRATIKIDCMYLCAYAYLGMLKAVMFYRLWRSEFQCPQSVIVCYRQLVHRPFNQGINHWHTLRWYSDMWVTT